VQFVHITDLHYARNSPFQKALIESLLSDAKELLANGTSPELLIFSGDLVNNPDDANIYEDFETFFLQPLLMALSLQPSSAIFCPGNHDVSQAAMKEWQDERRKLVEAMERGQDALDKLIQTAPTKAYLRALSPGFFKLADRCGHGWSNPLAHHYSFPTKKISLVALNTGYGCGLEGSKYDRGKLAISAATALGTFQMAPKDHRVVSLMHHTPSDLNESTSRVLMPVISNNSTVHLFGHVHQPNPTVQIASGSSCFMIQGGALYEKDGQYNGYSSVSIAPSEAHIAAHYRTYYVDRQQFDVGTNVAPNGVFYSSPASKSYWENLIPPASNDDVSLWLMETSESVAKELDKTITEKSLRDTFVEPMITKKSQADETANSNQRFSIADILKSTDDTVISCATEYGATALLSYLTMEFHNDCMSLPKSVVPLFLDGRRIRGVYEASVTKALRTALPESDDKRFKLAPLHDSGRLVVLVDDIDPSSIQHTNFIKAVRAYFPRARLIVAMKLDLLNTERLRPVIGIDKFDLLHVGALSRGRVRSLVEKWRLPHGYQIDTVVDEIHSRFQSLGIPQTAVYVAIYLSVLESIEGYNPINSSTVIETFVESSLQKYKPQYAFRSSFDYRNQIHYLGFIAEQMCRKNLFIIEYEEMYRLTKEHFDGIGVEHDYSKLIRHFIDNKVFADEGNSMYFRYNIFLSFFIAQQMQQSQEFLTWMLHDQRYTSYINEFDIYCGLSRQDINTLEFFSGEFGRLSATLEELVKPLSWTDRLEKLSIPAAKKTDTEDLTRSIEKQLTGITSASERDDAMSNTMQETDVKPMTERPEVMGTIPQWIMTLRAYTVALKNLENIPREKKEFHVQRVLQGWSTVILYGCIAFKEIIEERAIHFGNAHLKIELPEKVDARLLRMIFLTIPVLISEMLRRDLGSQKLALQLKNDSLAPTLSDSFLQTALYADLKLPEYNNRLKAFRAKADAHSSLIFQEILLIKMRTLFLRLGLQENEQYSFLSIAAEISADLKGLTGEEHQREIDRYTNDLRKRDQVNRLRDNMQ